MSLAQISSADWIILGVLAVVVLMLISLRAAVARLDLRLSRMQKSPENKASQRHPSADAEAHESAFEQFLAEDPTRLGMSKTEQFAAYRQWRKDKGMNWSA